MKIKRILARIRNASSSPVIAETEAGTCFVKLRGAAQGTLALVAEIIVAELAQAIGLKVPKRTLVTLDPNTPSDDHNDELAQLVSFSHGLNLGFEFLEGARDLRPDETNLIDQDTASKIVWLDALVTNPDRTARNTNILWHKHQPWLIDHGAALGFQYDWTRVDEQTAKRPYAFDRHLLIDRASHVAAISNDILSREAIDAAAAAVPDDFLTPHLGQTPLARRREAYAAVLWKRLKAHAAWAHTASTTGSAP